VWKTKISCAVILFSISSQSAMARDTRALLIYDEVATQADAASEEPDQLWISSADLARATRFELKPQGICRNELCFPLPKSRQSEFLRKHSGKTWFNMIAFAQLARQPIARDTALSTWYFGLRSDERSLLTSLQAPNFTLPDMDGKLHSLTDFRGKKVLLITWASW
jgi:hypothetical protein